MEEFLEQFQAVRKQMHLRRVKAEKMNDILSKKHMVSFFFLFSDISSVLQRYY